MINKEIAYIIFRTAWVLFLIANIAEFKPPGGMDLVPFIHFSKIPLLKYFLLLGFALLIIPAKDYLSLLKDRHLSIVLAFIVTLLGAALVSSYNSAFPETAMRVTGRIAFYVLILIITIAASKRFENASTFIVKSFIYASSLVVVGSLLDFFVPAFHDVLRTYFDRPGILHSHMKIANDIVMRPMGFITDANLAAFAVGISLMILLLNSSRFNKIFVYSYYILGSFVFGMLTSRIALIMCLVTITAYFFLKAVNRKKLFIFIGIFIALQAVAPQTYSRVVSLFDEEKIEEEFTVGRPVIWMAAFRLYSENKFIGAGPGVYFEYSRDYMSEILSSTPDININDPSKDNYHKVDKMNPHNIFLVMLSETGITGFSLFCGLLLYLLIYYLRKRQYLSVLFLFNIILISAFSNFAPYFKLYLVMAIILFIAFGKDIRLISHKSLNVQHEKNSDI